MMFLSKNEKNNMKIDYLTIKDKEPVTISEIFSIKYNWPDSVISLFEKKKNLIKFIAEKTGKTEEEILKIFDFEFINFNNNEIRLITYDLKIISKLRKYLIDFILNYIKEYNNSKLQELYDLLKQKNIEISEETFKNIEALSKLLSEIVKNQTQNKSQITDYHLDIIHNINIVYVLMPKKIYLNEVKRQLEAMYENEMKIFKDLWWKDLNSFINDMKKKIEENPYDPNIREQMDKFVRLILMDLVKNKGSSDIHIHTYSWYDKMSGRINYRSLGIYKLFLDNLPFTVIDQIIKIIWNIAGIQIKDEDYQFSGVIQNFPIDVTERVNFRVEIFQSLSKRFNGIPQKRCVLRTLPGGKPKTLEELNYMSDFINTIRSVVFSNKQGIIIISWPTGSGKSTLLYSVLYEYAKEKNDVCIYSIENPVEKDLNWRNIVQMEVDPARWMDFHRAVKALMRMDPDVVLVGEIRDKGTAETALELAKTGHLVFATLHVNNSIEIKSRLADLVADDSKIAELNNQLKAAIAQRLVGKLCNVCKIEVDKSEFIMEMKMKRWKDIQDKIFDINTFYKKGPWCPECKFTGLKWRLPVVEIIPYIKVVPDNELYKYLKYTIKFKNMFEYALDLLRSGQYIDYNDIIALYDPVTDIDLKDNENENEW